MENQLGTYSPDVCLVVVAVDDWASMDQVMSQHLFIADCVFLFLVSVLLLLLLLLSIFIVVMVNNLDLMEQ